MISNQCNYLEFPLLVKLCSSYIVRMPDGRQTRDKCIFGLPHLAGEEFTAADSAASRAASRLLLGRESADDFLLPDNGADRK